MARGRPRLENREKAKANAKQSRKTSMKKLRRKDREAFFAVRGQDGSDSDSDSGAEPRPAGSRANPEGNIDANDDGDGSHEVVDAPPYPFSSEDEMDVDIARLGASDVEEASQAEDADPVGYAHPDSDSDLSVDSLSDDAMNDGHDGDVEEGDCKFEVVLAFI